VARSRNHCCSGTATVYVVFPPHHLIYTLTEVFPCFFLSCKANARIKLAKMGNGPHSSKLVVICVVPLLICVVLFLFVLFYVLFVCKCVLYYCHRVLTEFFLLSYKANARIKLPKMGNGPHSSKLVVICVVPLLICVVLFLCVLFYILFVCKCVLYYCHRVLTELQLTNISYHIISYHTWHDFTESLLNIKWVFRFSLQFLSETFIVYEAMSEIQSKMYIGLHVKYPLFFFDCN